MDPVLQVRGLAVEVELPVGGRLLVREALTRGWRARVDGTPARIEPVGLGAVAVPLPRTR